MIKKIKKFYSLHETLSIGIIFWVLPIIIILMFYLIFPQSIDKKQMAINESNERIRKFEDYQYKKEQIFKEQLENEALDYINKEKTIQNSIKNN